MLYINYLSMWIYFLIYRNRYVTWDSLMPSFIQPTNIDWKLVRQALLQTLGLSQSSKDKVSTILELKFSWRRWKTSQCICNKVSVLIHTKEENGADHEESLADNIINIGQCLLICWKFYMYWFILYSINVRYSSL